MMKTIRLIMIISILMLSFGLAQAADAVAVVIKVRGDSKLTMAGSNKTQSIARGTRLESGSKIVTGKDGFVAMKFIDDGSLVRVRPNSTCEIEAKKQKGSFWKNLFVEVGTIFSKITKGESEFQVSTPTSVASVKGTAFWTKQEFKGATYFFGEEGVVEISNDAGSALLHEDETGYVSSSNSKPIVRKTKPGEKPELEEGDGAIHDFEFRFQDNQGNTKTLKIKAKEKQQ